MTRFDFPAGFILGTASSAFQIEGSPYADGKGETTWDYMARTAPELFFENAKPEPGSWFYRKYEEDIADMKKLGIKSFRLSICWSRILPEGTDKINQAGIDFYDRVIGLLLENGIEPFVDLYHWDTPQAIEERGGMKTPEFIDWFGAYARICFEHFGDRVKYWSTFNEPGVFCFRKYGSGGWYPYEKDLRSAYLAVHHTILAHYRAVQIYREMGLTGKIGAVTDAAAIYPLDPSGKDVLAAEYQTERMVGTWLDPFFFGHYPEKLLSDCPGFAELLPEGYAEDLRRCFMPIDMIGINYYYPATVRYDENELFKSTHAPSYYAQEGQRFDVYPAGLYDVMMYLTKRYNAPEIYVTENGLGHITTGTREGDVADDARITYLREHLRMLVRAVRAGASVRGYYYWSHFDSLESTSGYRWKFGLVHVDPETGERTKKKSWYYYRRIIRENCVD